MLAREIPVLLIVSDRDVSRAVLCCVVGCVIFVCFFLPAVSVVGFACLVFVSHVLLVCLFLTHVFVVYICNCYLFVLALFICSFLSLFMMSLSLLFQFIIVILIFVFLLVFIFQVGAPAKSLLSSGVASHPLPLHQPPSEVSGALYIYKC